ncbi:MAG TPA: hypothetical protein VIR65_14930 [Rhizorhapis sp.]|jgi:hypothetical protein
MSQRGTVDRWSLSSWLLYRPDHGNASLANAGQLGASQVGARLAYDLSPKAAYSLAMHARVTSALQSPLGTEAALGMTWRPARSLPLAFSVERRIAVAEGGRNAFAAYAAGGAGPVPLMQGVLLEGYAQAGVVGASRTDPFIDGRITVGHRLQAVAGEKDLMVGIALSGGAQPSLSRLDIGPQISARLPIGKGHARLALEWRQRIAGRARPPSGLAVILSSDF